MEKSKLEKNKVQKNSKMSEIPKENLSAVPEVNSVQERQITETNKKVRYSLPAQETNMVQLHRAAREWSSTITPAQLEMTRAALELQRNLNPSINELARAAAELHQSLESPLFSLGKIALEFKTFYGSQVTQVSRAAEEIRKSLDFSPKTVSDVFLRHLENLPSNYQLAVIETGDAKDTIVEAQPEMVVKNEVTHDEIPLSEIPTTFGVLDILDNLTEEEVLMFYQHLSVYPMMGLQHEVGKKILNGVQQAPLKTLDGLPIRVYRARIRDAGRKTPFSILEMFEAPYGIASNGRWNLTGHGTLYTCDTLEAAIQELGRSDEIIDVVEWDLNHPIQYLDLTDRECPLFNFCHYPASKNQRVEPAYLVPNFLAQCCQMAGIEAIKYKSAAYKGAINYVFFEPSKKWFEQINFYPDK
ncbi:RES family NAD+ phosphorylase [Cytobacillus oceanisediminis]|uniref:RES domain-containing protein n=1 Tax=Cytobacillus oceanisediminis 2691 TaxID=1196031 RepID=A0A160MEB7_9BACI|nr:RES family NAD+ phosphorylase [Cytobacillus oceanisediminis]AND41420.1 hypothetical protein A361_20395 [Cytobacillus oceanisediminis 2691]